MAVLVDRCEQLSFTNVPQARMNTSTWTAIFIRAMNRGGIGIRCWASSSYHVKALGCTMLRNHLYERDSDKKSQAP